MAVTEAKQITKPLFNRNQARKALQRQHICLTEYDRYFILDEIKSRDTFEDKKDIIFDDNE